MAGIVETVSDRIKDAMRAKARPSRHPSHRTRPRAARPRQDSEKLNALRNMRSALLLVMKESNATTLADDKAVETLRKLAKQRADSISQYAAGGRADLVASEEKELALIESFLPQLADEATTMGWVQEAIAQLKASKPGDAGRAAPHERGAPSGWSGGSAQGARAGLAAPADGA